MRRIDRRIAKRYLAAAPAPKLHIGCGRHVLPGWLNSDLHPRRGVLRLDATRAFPFEAGAFAYVYVEHVIGGLTAQGAVNLLSECFRVLAPGGILRLATPDLEFLTGLCGPRRSATQERYLEWFGDETAMPNRPAGVVVNRYLGAWQLQAVYDAPLLGEMLEAAGFADVTVRGLNESDHDALRGLANEARMPAGLLRAETLTVEGSKPVHPEGCAQAAARSGAGNSHQQKCRATALARSTLAPAGPLAMARLARRKLRRLPRILQGTDRRIAAHHLARQLASEPAPKLHLGCGDHLLEGWLNTDLAPCAAGVMHLDATRRFPFPDGTFAYVYTEYMLGSLAFGDVPAMLSECCRVLAPGGKVRVATTDLAALLTLYSARDALSELQERYVRWATARRLAHCRHGLCREDRAPDAAGAPAVFLNHHLHSDLARFTYDAPTLSDLLAKAGFSAIVQCEQPNQSEDAALCGLANAGRMPAGFLQLECLVMEGTKQR